MELAGESLLSRRRAHAGTIHVGKGLRDELAPANPAHRVHRPDVTPRTVIHDRGMAPHRASSTSHLQPPSTCGRDGWTTWRGPDEGSPTANSRPHGCGNSVTLAHFRGLCRNCRICEDSSWQCCCAAIRDAPAGLGATCRRGLSFPKNGSVHKTCRLAGPERQRTLLCRFRRARRARFRAFASRPRLMNVGLPLDVVHKPPPTNLR